MRCPKCDCEEDKVIDTRVSKDGDVIRRRRECLGCEYRYTTRESVLRTEVAIVKRDGAREEFDPDKLYLGIKMACWKRPVSGAQMDQLVSDITAKLFRMSEREVSSLTLGEMVMTGLKRLDEVAYVRFASVYRRFKDIDEFIDEVQSLSENGGRKGKE